MPLTWRTSIESHKWHKYVYIWFLLLLFSFFILFSNRKSPKQNKKTWTIFWSQNTFEGEFFFLRLFERKNKSTEWENLWDLLVQCLYVRIYLREEMYIESYREWKNIYNGMYTHWIHTVNIIWFCFIFSSFLTLCSLQFVFEYISSLLYCYRCCCCCCVRAYISL